MSALTLILISGIAGASAGAVLIRSIDPQRKTARDQSEHLRKMQEELAHTRQQMNDHFTQASQLVQAITDDCRRLQDHVAIDALKLTGLDLREASTTIEESSLHLAKLTAGQAVEPPRDYAPKTKGSIGMLSEEYGLHDDFDDEPKPAHT